MQNTCDVVKLISDKRPKEDKTDLYVVRHVIEQRVNKAITKVLRARCQPIYPEKCFVADFRADSLDHVEMVMALEGEFNIKISDQEARGVLTVQETYALVIAKLALSGK